MKKTILIAITMVFTIGLSAEIANADFTFDPPTDLGAMVNSLTWDGEPHISPDCLELYLNSVRLGGYGDWDIWVTKRQTEYNDWGEPVNLGPLVNSSTTDTFPCLSADGLSLYFGSKRPGGYGGFDIWVARRATIDNEWYEPFNLGPPVNSSYDDAWCCISTDGLELYLSGHTTNRPAGYGGIDLWVSRRLKTYDPWGEPSNLGLLVNSSSNDCAPSISSDGMSIFFASDRPGGHGNLDLWVTKRRTVSDPWGFPVNLGPIVNSRGDDTDPDISSDGATLYFSSDRGDVRNLWQVTIIPMVDFNGDGIVDSADMCIMIDHWGENYSLCDIGPTPLGDGVVDVEDLKVLAEYLFGDMQCVAHFKLDEVKGNIANDSARNRDGTVHGSPEWQPTDGVFGGALQFDGFDDYVRTGFTLNPVDGPFSVFAWIKGGAPGQIVLSQIGVSNWLLADPSEGNLMTKLRSPSRDAAELLSQTIITDGNWHRIGLVWDGANRILYVDDVAVAQDTQESLEGSGSGLYIGCGKGMEADTFFSGLIDDVRIYNKALTAEEIASLTQ